MHPQDQSQPLPHQPGAWAATPQVYPGQAMAPAPGYAMQLSSGVQVVAKMSFLQWMLYFVQPIVTIGGQSFPIRFRCRIG